MNRKLKQLAASAAFAAGLAGSAHAECGDVSITQMDWESAIVVTSVSTFLLEQGYGCNVTVIPSASVPALASVSETGKPDILTEIWANSATAYDKLIEDGVIRELTDVLSDGGVEGFWIPDYLAEAHPELTTLQGVVANPELVGKRFHNCPEGWTCQVIGTNITLAAGFEQAGIENWIHGSGETLAASLASAYDNKEPWFGYYWAPTSLLGRYSMVPVDIGPHDPEVHECNRDRECATPKIGAWPASKVATVVTNSFAESHPEETALMKNVSFTNDIMGALLAWKQENKASGEEAAVYFLNNYKDIWRGWLNDAARAQLSALLQ
ncbi:MAG: ABC transporter substrate-binding protein [Rhodospirillales bacterium]|nr:ABC transporter substrate-binding protein [Rhodospirillales bacterium]